MTKFEVQANCNGTQYKIEFDVPKELTQSDWDQFSKLIKMACQQMSK